MKKAAIFAAPNDTEIIPNYTFRFNRPSSWISCNSLFLYTLTLYFLSLYSALFVFPPLVANSPCQRSARSPRMRRGRTASFTGRLGLNIRSPLAAAENKLRRMGRAFAVRRTAGPATGHL